MPHFSKIHVQGFRRLKDVELPLGPLNVLVGPNGAGKTSLLDAFRLLSSSADGKLRECLAAWRGINELISAKPGSTPILPTRAYIEKAFRDHLIKNARDYREQNPTGEGARGCPRGGHTSHLTDFG